MEKKVYKEESGTTRGEIYKDSDYNPTPFETSANLVYIHHSDGGKTELLHKKPSKANGGRPALVMVAGFITILDSWEVFLSGVSEEFEVYYWETREKGTFHPPQKTSKSTFSIERFTLDLQELIEALELNDGEYLLAGSSFGGTIMIDALAEKRVTPHTAILIGANTNFRIPFPGIPVARITPSPFLKSLKPIIKWYIRSFMIDMEADERQYMKYAKAINLANFKFIKGTILNYHKHPQHHILPLINVPTIVVGADKDKMHTIEETKMTVDVIPNAEMASFDTNHDTHSEPFTEYIVNKFG